MFTWIARFEVPLILASRFIWGLPHRDSGGMRRDGRLSPTRFTAADVTGAVIWSLVRRHCRLDAMGEALDYPFADLRRYEWWIAGVLAVIALVIAGFRWRPDTGRFT